MTRYVIEMDGELAALLHRTGQIKIVEEIEPRSRTFNTAKEAQDFIDARTNPKEWSVESYPKDENDKGEFRPPHRCYRAVRAK